jgi:hypothetical protein
MDAGVMEEKRAGNQRDHRPRHIKIMARRWGETKLAISEFIMPCVKQIESAVGRATADGP